jgi:hypothetical protein
VVFSREGDTVRLFEGMQSYYFNIFWSRSQAQVRPGCMHLVTMRRQGPRNTQPVDENFALHATLSVIEEKCKSRILEGKCLGNRP